MSDLQISLIILGIVIIIAVIVYNWRQEKKLRNRIGHDFIVPQKDILVEDFYVDTDALVEQTFEGDARKTEIVQQLDTKDADVEVSSENLPEIDEKEDDIPVVAQSEQRKPEVIVEDNETLPPSDVVDVSLLPTDVHAQVDLIAILTAIKPMNGQALLAMKQEILKDIGVLTMLHGTDNGSNWRRIDETTSHSDTFKKIVCSLQLADRRGPVPKAIINKFQFAMEAIGVEFQAYVEWQSEDDPAQRAIDLDAFCIHVDQLVSLHLIQGKTPIHGTKFKGLAEAHDMQLKDGKFYCFDESNKKQALFTLVNADDQPFTAESLRLNIVRGATFQIEVPKLVNCEQTFNRVVLVAQQMAGSIGAQMVDDNQRPLGTTQIEKIRQQLKEIHSTMVAREIIPGSSVSQRLFS